MHRRNSKCCKNQSFWEPVKWDISMMFRPFGSFFWKFFLEWKEGMEDVKSDGSLGDETEKGVVFIGLYLITMLLHLSALKVRPAHFRTLVQRESKVFALKILEDMFRSSMMALIGGNKTLFRWNCDVVAKKKYSRITFISVKKTNYRQSATNKNATLMPMPNAGCLLRKTCWISQGRPIRLSRSIVRRHHIDGLQR